MGSGGFLLLVITPPAEITTPPPLAPVEGLGATSLVSSTIGFDETGTFVFVDDDETRVGVIDTPLVDGATTGSFFGIVLRVIGGGSTFFFSNIALRLATLLVPPKEKENKDE